MKRLVWAAILFLAVGLPAFAITVRSGTGTPEDQWCPLGWWGSKGIGHGGLTEEGFLLSAAITPPVSAYELALKFVPYADLLFVLESPAPVGKINVYLDSRLLRTVEIPTKGRWWLRVSELPTSGVLRIELGPYCQELLIRSVNYLCQPAQPPDCRLWLILGLVVGAFLMWLILH